MAESLLDKPLRGLGWRHIAGGIVLLIPWLYWLLQLVATMNWVAGVIGRPDLTAGALALLASPPPWLLSLVTFTGVGLILWGERRRNEGLRAFQSKTNETVHRIAPLVLAINDEFKKLEERGVYAAHARINDIENAINTLGEEKASKQFVHDEFVRDTAHVLSSAETVAAQTVSSELMELRGTISRLSLELDAIRENR